VNTLHDTEGRDAAA